MRHCTFEIVAKAKSIPSALWRVATRPVHTTIADRVIDGDQIEAASTRLARMGEQLFAVVYKRRLKRATKNGESVKMGARIPCAA